MRVDIVPVRVTKGYNDSVEFPSHGGFVDPNHLRPLDQIPVVEVRDQPNVEQVLVGMALNSQVGVDQEFERAD